MTKLAESLAREAAERQDLIRLHCAAAGLPTPPRGALKVACPLCRAKVGDACRKPSGAAAQLHQRRLRAAMDAEHRRASLLVLLHDDLRMGLSAGDVLHGIARRGNGWEIFERVSDAFDPECLQSGRDVAWVAWA